MAVWRMGVPTEFRRTGTGIEPVAVIGRPFASHPGDPPVCPACGVPTTSTKVKGTSVALCENTACRPCGPASRTPADNAAKHPIAASTVVDGDTVEPDPGVALVAYVKG